VSTCSPTNEWNVCSWFSCTDLRPPWVQARTVVEGEPSHQFPLLKSRLIAVDSVMGVNADRAAGTSATTVGSASGDNASGKNASATAFATAFATKQRHKRQRLYCDQLTGQHWLSIIVSLCRYDESREILKPVSRDVADSISGKLANTGHLLECRP